MINPNPVESCLLITKKLQQMKQYRKNMYNNIVHQPQEQPQQASLLYIGKNYSQLKSQLPFSNVAIAPSFAKAKKIIRHLSHFQSQQPTFILIDLPFDKAGLPSFCFFLKSNPWSVNIPVIYNEAALKPVQCKTLFLLRLVDDVCDVCLYSDELIEKANFINKTKAFLHQANDIKNMQAAVAKLRLKTRHVVKDSIRRVLDVVTAMVLLILALPVILLITILIKLEDKGPILYRSKRAGKGYRIFDFYKFRTMIENADLLYPEMQKLNMYKQGLQNPVLFKAKNDPRITKIGAFLRSTSLDELPQLINVIKGDMSLVGNRPLPLYEAATLTNNEWAERFMAPAGMTGVWQLEKTSRNANIDAKERLQLDINYARNNNLLKDFWILLSTPKVIFQKTNA